MDLKRVVAVAVAVIFLSVFFFVATLYVLQYLSFGTRGLVQDVRIEAGMGPRRTVDTVYIQKSDLETLQEAYTPEREKQWIANINESEVMTDLTLTGVGNLTHVTGSYDSSKEPEVLIHSHRPNATGRLSGFDKEWLRNASRKALNRGEEREDLYRMSCILHRKWRFTKPQLYCYANPFIYRDTEVSEGGFFNRVSVTVLD
ncbi:hypothetical protein [Halorarum halobium]|uniref:hypothetical protein n=1 Tax=Halorarum halobium TaxID=3075121 RepID=UPI0028A587D9|nr:hypothetical protein [Halobaculum sp. XH14]